MKIQLAGTTVAAAAIAAVATGGTFHMEKLDRDWRIRQIEPGAVIDAGAFALVEANGQTSAEEWIPVAGMPAMVHDVLRERGVIESPWLPGRAEACRWVAESDWLYATTFDVAAANRDRTAWLRFKGLDTIVDVFLNGAKIATHTDQHAPLRVAITGKLREKNTLVLRFHQPFELADGKPVPLRSFADRPVRRPQQNYSSYLGPNPFFSRVGVYDDIQLEFSDGTEFTKVMVGASLDASLKRGTVVLDLAGNAQETKAEIRGLLRAPNGSVAGTWERSVAPKPGSGVFEEHLEIAVPEPQLWWPRGYGDQPLYTVEVSLFAEGGEVQTMVRRVGFRHVTMPKPLHFEINGRPVRLWGGCWVSPTWDSIVWDPERARQLFTMAEHANFNAFRVWGVVEAPPDDFYDLAAERGFLIWQDFTQLPLGSDDARREFCRAEAERLITRLKHHPSIVVWCGGNEAAMWHHEEFNATLEDKGPWPGLVAAKDVGAVCVDLDPDRYYQPSTPYGGIDPNDPRELNTHGYTNMWWVPGYDYLNFASEDTRIAAPPLHSLQRFMAPEDIWPPDYSPVWAPGSEYPFPETWLRYTSGTSWKKTGPVELFYDATDAASLVHRLGMAEALYYQDTIERQRRGRAPDEPEDLWRSGGYLVWKFNDSWPQVYSAKVDYFLEPYHTYYTLRRAFAPHMLSFEVGAFIRLWAVNDSPDPIDGVVTIQLLHLDRNEVRREIVRPVKVAPGRSGVVVRLDEAGIGTFRREHVLLATLREVNGREITRTNVLGDIERRTAFPDARIDVRVDHDGALVLTTDKFARTVYLSGDADGDAFGWFFEDNYFDLAPGETKTVRILGKHGRGSITAKPFYSPHATRIDWAR